MRRRVRRIVVLGCGPAGIFAAHAAVRAGFDISQVQIVSNKRRSEMYGAQYLHSPIPGLSIGDSDRISYELRGTADKYAQKVYGEERPSFVSPDALLGTHDAWDIRDAYYRGYAEYEDRIIHMPGIDANSLMPGSLGASNCIWPLLDAKDVQIISTIPLHKICKARDRHTFKGRRIWTVGTAPERGQTIDWADIPAQTVICNGEDSPSWYRASNVFGYKTLEWAYGDSDNRTRPPYDGVVETSKVVSTDCNCYRGRIWFAGRTGTWDKNVLAHMAYTFTFSALGGGR